MSVGSQSQNDPRERPLQDREIAILRKLFGNREGNIFGELKAIDLSDGNMGSIRFQHDTEKQRKFGAEVARAQYIDKDGVLVSMTLNLDEAGKPYEMDFWRVDFAPLQRYPSPDQITLEN